jgi:hypothetical protein
MTKKKKPINPAFKVVGIAYNADVRYMAFTLVIRKPLFFPGGPISLTKETPLPSAKMQNFLIAPPTIRSFS